MSKGQLIVYSGPSGVGKGTLMYPYLQEHPEAVLSISMTTRQPRPGETDGVEYYFVSHEEFEKQIIQDGLLEYARYSGNYYGTPRKMVEERIQQGQDVVLEIEVQGAMKIKQSYPDAVFIFVLPPSFSVLEARLRGRGTESEEVIAARLAAAKRELGTAALYDYIIVNDDLEQARKRLEAVIAAAKCQTKYMKDFIDEVTK